MRALVFAKRNFKEIVREPLSLIFCIGFPVILLLIFQLIISNFTMDEVATTVPQFQISRLAPSSAVFGFSFLTLFSGMIISKDRSTSFLDRLRTSPMRANDFILGYTLPLLPLALIQVIVTYVLGIIFGLKITGTVLLSMLTLIPISILFICLGLLLGTLFTDKTLGGVSSLLINLAAIFSGMFMPLENLGKTINIIADVMPFSNSLKLTNCIITGNYENFWRYLIVLLAYTFIVVFLSIFVFHKKLNSDKN